ncbi:PilZ domain-containing protein [Marinobacter bohaiensis]|uniref:PilZ domain-containing protein n=1 Tax=Marinobacter bohaiensis TaxID=2201898 RepID=UPI000DAD92DB|nr:PilZ domain-containing protein [Marinobacter bohaiensis]
MAIGDYEFGHYEFGDGPETDHEQRREFRLSGRVSVHLELESAGPTDATDAPRALSCYTVDLSARGIRVAASEPVPEGAILPAVVTLKRAADEAVYRLMVEVVWCRREDERGWTVGLEVLESDDTEILEWLETIVRALDDD